MSLTLCVRPGDYETIVSVGGELDICVASGLLELLRQVIQTHGPALLLDLSEVPFMDCAGLGAIVGARREALSRGGSTRLIAASRAVRRVIDLTGMREEFLAIPAP